jgi:CDP-glucose 4,6-dehydratase
MLDLNLAQGYCGRRVLVTGHTGFKGSWLALWLCELGAHVHGVSLNPPTNPSHWDLLSLRIDEHRSDIRDTARLAEIIRVAEPECVFHLAAQPLVRRSYRDPLETWSTNVMGTVSVLDACRAVSTVRAIVVVTSDKCYANDGRTKPYREDDRLGGHDPYSASKAAVELAAASHRAAFLTSTDAPLLATARGGNMIGGGDFSEDRLVPDLVRAQAGRTSLAVRSPLATRPWQHVLDCLAGYLQLGMGLLAGRRELARPWNFGPDAVDTRSVEQLLEAIAAHWPGLRWHPSEAQGPHEATALMLDSELARTKLGWRPAWTIDEALAKTAAWYRRFLADATVVSRAQLADYVDTAPCMTQQRSTR